MSDELDLGVLTESFSEFLGGEWPREKAVAYARGDASHAADLWQQVADLGWTALTVPEEQGGLGMSGAALAGLHEALGAAATPLPMLGTTLAIALVQHAGTQAQAEALLPRLADGSERVAIAQLDADLLDASGPTLDGVVSDILDAPSASLLLLRATQGGNRVWLALPAATDGVAIERTPLGDTTRSLGTVVLKGVPTSSAQVLTPADPAFLDDEMLRLASIVLAADSLGGGEAVLVATIEYMKVREQFGRVIGSFQALKHRVADHKAAIEASRGLIAHAASFSAGEPSAILAALTAKQHITRTMAEIARDCIQLHGGVGFTSEYVPHIYLKRAKLNEALHGTRSQLLDRIADMLEAA